MRTGQHLHRYSRLGSGSGASLRRAFRAGVATRDSKRVQCVVDVGVWGMPALWDMRIFSDQASQEKKRGCVIVHLPAARALCLLLQVKSLRVFRLAAVGPLCASACVRVHLGVRDQAEESVAVDTK